MDSSHYRNTTTRRGYTYRSWCRASGPGNLKPTIVFLHGFPSTSKDWEAQVAYFAERGYGLIVPDLLGYGGSSHPTEPAEYVASSIAEDIYDVIKDVVGALEKVVVIGHDWGSSLASRLWHLHPERLLAAGFLAVGYSPLSAEKFDYEKALKFFNQLSGSDILGYWEFFGAEDAAELATKNIDSFYSLFFPQDPKLWKTDLAPRHKAREWVEKNKQGPSPNWFGEAAKKQHQSNLMNGGGWIGPLNYYVATMSGLNDESASQIPPERSEITVPTFFGATLQDYVCLPDIQKPRMERFIAKEKLTVREFDSGHWVMLEKPSELNEKLEAWLESIV